MFPGLFQSLSTSPMVLEHQKPLKISWGDGEKEFSGNKWPLFIQKWAFNSAGWNQYGLYHDDALFEHEDVKEAVRRLPPSIQVRGEL